MMLSPKQGGFHINRALARYQQHNLRGAMDDYNEALELMPDNYLGHYNRALLRMQVGENNLAIEDFDFVLARRPSDRLALYNRAILSQQTGNYRRAISDYTTVLKDYPNFSGAYVNRAYCYARIGDNRRAEADERKAMQIRLNEVYRNKAYSTPLDSVTRHEDEADIEDYDKLVDDSEENIVPVYASEYRGRVQNREVAAVHQPAYTPP
jgi:tetratricopeptide (TPR) repeat protein